MQEKQRLAQQQEQVQRFKQQSALNVTSKPTNQQSASTANNQSMTPKPTNQLQTRDLTSTLGNCPNYMASGVNQMNSSQPMSQPSYPPMGNPNPAPNPFINDTGLNNQAAMTGNFMQSGMLSPTNQQHTPATNSNKKIDLSAFDSLLPSSGNQNKQSMNTMARQSTPVANTMPMGYGMPQNAMSPPNMMMGMQQQQQRMPMNGAMGQGNNAAASDFDSLFG